MHLIFIKQKLRSLLSRSLPYTSGYSSVFQNIGSTETSGVEFGINAVIIDNPEGLSLTSI